MAHIENVPLFAGFDMCQVLSRNGMNFRMVFEGEFTKIFQICSIFSRIISFEVLRSLSHDLNELLSVIISSISRLCRYMKI